MNNSNNGTNKGNYCFYSFLRRGSREKCQALQDGKMATPGEDQAGHWETFLYHQYDQTLE